MSDLVAEQAGVSQEELDDAVEKLSALEAELAKADENLAAALAAKEEAYAAYQEALAAAHAASKARDPIYEEYQRAAWIARNADPDYPAPPTGIVPPRVIAQREES